MSAEEILAAAADLVEQSWVQSPHLGFMDRRRGPWCAGMALNAAPDRADEEAEAVECALFQAHLALRREIGTFDVAGWNDAPGRRMEEVATALRSAKRWLP